MSRELLNKIIHALFQKIGQFILLSQIFLIYSCEDQIVNQCDIVVGENIKLSEFSSIQKYIFDVSCSVSGCHSGNNPAANLNLESGKSYSELVNIDAVLVPGEKRVIPFDSKNSILIKILNGEVSPKMPIGAESISNEVIDSIALWIDKGALDD